jgi:hypothetical protein
MLSKVGRQAPTLDEASDYDPVLEAGHKGLGGIRQGLRDVIGVCPGVAVFIGTGIVTLELGPGDRPGAVWHIIPSFKIDRVQG